VHDIKESSPAAATCAVAAQTLNRILSTQVQPHQDFALRLSAAAVARLVSEHITGDPPAAAVLRWYPAFEGTISVVPVAGEVSSIEIRGHYTSGTGPVTNAHWERRTIRDAVHVLLHMLTHAAHQAQLRINRRAA